MDAEDLILKTKIPQALQNFSSRKMLPVATIPRWPPPRSNCDISIYVQVWIYIVASCQGCERSNLKKPNNIEHYLKFHHRRTQQESRTTLNWVGKTRETLILLH